MMMHAPAAAKCLGEEKTMCNLQKEKYEFSATSQQQRVQNVMHYIILSYTIRNLKIQIQFRSYQINLGFKFDLIFIQLFSYTR